MLLTTIRKLVGSKLVMATDDEQAVQFEEFRKQLISRERGVNSVENKKMVSGCKNLFMVFKIMKDMRRINTKCPQTKS